MFVTYHQLVRMVFVDEWSINKCATTHGYGSSEYQDSTFMDQYQQEVYQIWDHSMPILSDGSSSTEV